MSGYERKGKRKTILVKTLASITLVALIAFTIIAVQSNDRILSMFGKDAIDSTATASTVTDNGGGVSKPYTWNSDDK